ncbi:MAG: EMC3/TMCO1 family protein [Candidatus Hermodarchaeota archaeon]
MANGEIIIQIMLITIGMVALSELLNRIFGLNMGAARELRERSQNLQERMRTARLTGNPQEMMELQQESIDLTKQMMKKQMLPSCIRCIIFLSIFAVIGLFYADYLEGLLPFPILFFGSGWFAIYFLFSISFSLILYGFKRLYRKLTGKDVERKKALGGMLGGFSPQAGGQEQHLELTRKIPSEEMQEQVMESLDKDDQEQSKADSWKERIKK